MTKLNPNQPPRKLLPLVLLFTAIASFANGAVGHGIFFIAFKLHGFSDIQNLALAFCMYLPYIPAAYFAGRITRRWGDRRVILFAIFVMTMCVAALAWATGLMAAESVNEKTQALSRMVIWISAPVYISAAGLMWPIVESYLTAGRHGQDMRRAIGIWNIVWATTICFGLLVVGRFLDNPQIVFIALFVAHLFTAIIVIPWPSRVPHHDAELGVQHHGPEYGALLQTSQSLLFFAYVLGYALTPLLPGVWARLHIGLEQGAFWSSAWLFARLMPFILMFVFAGWHGKWAVPLLGGVLLLTGFVTTVVAVNPWMAVSGLSLFGLGHAMVYFAALYYRMAIGHADVNSGGTHEALIGLGYTVGPAVAIAGSLATANSPQIGLLIGIGGVSTIALYRAARPCIHSIRSRRSSSTSV